ncbi:MAG: CBS domain-containing protein [Thermoleophilaceae bacterium]
MLHLSALVRSPLVDRAGEKLGRVEDVIVRLADEGFPPVTGLQARIGGRDLFVPVAQVASLTGGRAQLAGEKLNLGRFERRPGEVLLRHDLLGRKLVHVAAAQLATAHDIELMCVEGWWRVVGIDAGARGLLRRWLHRSGHGETSSAFIEWTELEPFVGHVPSARLRFRHRKLSRLHPSQIADLVEAASHEEGEEIINAVRQDRELEADVFEELDDEHQLEFIRERSDPQVAAVLSRMANDDAADLILELDQERRQPVLDMLPAARQRQIRALLGYNPSTAGGLMGTEFVSLALDSSAADGLARVRASRTPPEATAGVYLEDESGCLAGWLTLVELVRAPGDRKLAEIAVLDPISVAPDADLPGVARLMTDRNLTMLPVVDEGNRVVGVITVDDVLELTLPSGWRRRYGLAER